MRADRIPSTRHVRVLALVAILLTTLAAMAPALAQTGGQAAHHLHALRATGYTTSDYGPSTVRTDQPAVTVHSSPTGATARSTADEPDTGAASDQTAADAPTSRGPPGG